MARKQKFDYFDAFVRISDCAVDYANALVEFLDKEFENHDSVNRINPDDTIMRFNELHKIEEKADGVTHEIYTQLADEFVTPIDREDILDLVSELDSVVDDVDEVLQRMYMYNISILTLEVIDMAHLVQKTVVALRTACEKFTHFKKSKSIHEYIVKVHDCEDEGDRFYIKAMHDLYARRENGDEWTAFDAFGLGGMLAALERCCDACEAAADTIALVLVKNS